MKLKIVLLRSLRNCVGILVGIALNLQNAFTKMSILTMLILLIHEQGKSFQLLTSSSIPFFIKGLKFLSYQSFTCLSIVLPRFGASEVGIREEMNLIHHNAHISLGLK